MASRFTSVLDVSVEQLRWEKELGRVSFDAVMSKIKKKQRPNVLVVHDKPIKLVAYATWLELMGCQVSASLDGRKAFMLFEATLRGPDAPSRYDCIFVELPVNLVGGVDMVDFAAHVRTEERRRKEKEGQRFHHPIIAICKTKENATEMLQHGYSHFLRTPFVHSLGRIRQLLLPPIYNTRERAKLGKRFPMYPDIEGVLGSVATGGAEQDPMEKTSESVAAADDASHMVVRALKAKVQYLEVNLDSKRAELTRMRKEEQGQHAILGNVSKLSMEVREKTAEAIKFRSMYEESVERLLREKMAKDMERRKRYKDVAKKAGGVEELQQQLLKAEQDQDMLSNEVHALRSANEYLTAELASAVTDEARRRLKQSNRITYAASAAQWETPPPSREPTPEIPPPYRECVNTLVDMLEFIKKTFVEEGDDCGNVLASPEMSSLSPAASMNLGHPKGSRRAGSNVTSNKTSPWRGPVSPRVAAPVVDSDGDSDGGGVGGAAPTRLPRNLALRMHQFTNEYVATFNAAMGVDLKEMLDAHRIAEALRLKEERDNLRKSKKKGKQTQAEMKAELEALRQEVKDLNEELRILEERNEEMTGSGGGGGGCSPEDLRAELEAVRTREKEWQAKYESVAPDLEAAKAAFQKERTLRENAEEKQRMYKLTAESGGMEALQRRCDEWKQACESVQEVAVVKQEYLQGIRDLEVERLEEFMDMRVDCITMCPGWGIASGRLHSPRSPRTLRASPRGSYRPSHVTDGDDESAGGTSLSRPRSNSPSLRGATDADGEHSPYTTPPQTAPASDHDIDGESEAGGGGARGSKRGTSPAYPAVRRSRSGSHRWSFARTSKAGGDTGDESTRSRSMSARPSDASAAPVTPRLSPRPSGNDFLAGDRDAYTGEDSPSNLAKRLSRRSFAQLPSVLNPRCIEIHKAIGAFLMALQRSHAHTLKLHNLKGEFDTYFQTVDDLQTPKHDPAEDPCPSPANKQALSDKVLEEVVLSDERMLKSLTRYIEESREIGRETGKVVFTSIRATLERKAQENALNVLQQGSMREGTPRVAADNQAREQLRDLRRQMEEKSRVIAQCQMDRSKLKEARIALQSRLKEEHRALVRDRAEKLAQQMQEEKRAKMEARAGLAASMTGSGRLDPQMLMNAVGKPHQRQTTPPFQPIVNVASPAAAAATSPGLVSHASFHPAGVRSKLMLPPNKHESARPLARHIADMVHQQQQQQQTQGSGGRRGPGGFDLSPGGAKHQLTPLALVGRTNTKRSPGGYVLKGDDTAPEVAPQQQLAPPQHPQHLRAAATHTQASSPAAAKLAKHGGGAGGNDVTGTSPAVAPLSLHTLGSGELSRVRQERKDSLVEAVESAAPHAVAVGGVAPANRHLVGRADMLPVQRSPRGKAAAMMAGMRAGGVHSLTNPAGPAPATKQPAAIGGSLGGGLTVGGGGRQARGLSEPDLAVGLTAVVPQSDVDAQRRPAAVPAAKHSNRGGDNQSYGVVHKPGPGPRTLPTTAVGAGAMLYVAQNNPPVAPQPRVQGGGVGAHMNAGAKITTESPFQDIPMTVGVRGRAGAGKHDDGAPAVNADGSQPLPPLKKNPKGADTLVAHDPRHGAAGVHELQVQSKFPVRGNPFKKER